MTKWQRGAELMGGT